MERVAGSNPGRLLRLAAVRHGHACPSLTYGVLLGVALLQRLPAGTVPRRVVAGHSSTCLLDGAATVLEEALRITPESERGAGRCYLSATWEGGRVTVGIRREVRAKVDLLKAGRDLEAFRAEGVAWLLGLAEGDLIDPDPVVDPAP